MNYTRTAIEAVAQHIPGFGLYADLLEFQGVTLGHGRVHATTCGALFEHLLIERRIMCQDAGRNFSDVESRALAKLKRSKITWNSSVRDCLMYALFRDQVLDDPKLWNELKEAMA